MRKNCVKWFNFLLIALLFSNSNAYALSKQSDIVLQELGISFKLKDSFYEFTERGVYGFLFSAKNSDNFIFRVDYPDLAPNEAHVLSIIQGKNNHFDWQNDVKIGNNYYFIYHEPIFLTWYVWLKSADRSVICTLCQTRQQIAFPQRHLNFFQQ